MQTSLGRRALLGAGVAAAALPRRARAADKPIRIGVLTDMAGAYAANTGPGSVLGAQMAIEDFCARIPTIKVELVQADLQLKPDVALAIAGDWFDNQGVDLITDVPLSSAAFAIGDMAKAEGQGGDLHRRRLGRHHRRALRPEPSALGLRHLVDAARRGRCDGEGRRRHLVLHHRRLCVRPFAGEGRRQFRHRGRRQGARPGAGAVSRHDRLLLATWCRRRRAAPR